MAGENSPRAGASQSHGAVGTRVRVRSSLAESPFLPFLSFPSLGQDGSAAAPQDPPTRGRTHQLRKEEGVGDSQEQCQSCGHVWWRMAGWGRQVPGGHARTLPSAWLRSRLPAARQISPPVRHTHQT